MTLLHTALWVSDLDASIAFYEDLLGYEIVREFENDDGIRNVFLGHPDPSADDDAALQLLAADGPVDPGDFEHVALAIDDVDAALNSLDEDRIVGGPNTLEDAGVRVAFIEDVDGWGVELIEQL